MKKYQTEFKLEVVSSFLAGGGGEKLLVRQWFAPKEKIRTPVSQYLDIEVADALELSVSS